MSNTISLFFEKYRFILLFLGVVFLGILTGINSIITLVLIAGLLVFMLTLQHTELVYYITLSAFISTPLENFKYFSTIIPIIKLSIFELQFLLIFAVVVIKILLKKIDLKKVFISKAYYLLIAAIVIYIGIGFVNNNEYLNSDIRRFYAYIVFFLTMVLLKKDKEDSMKLFFRFNIIVTFILSLFAIIIFIFRNSIFSYLFTDILYGNEGRVGFGSMSIFILTVPIIMIGLRLRYISSIWRNIGTAAILLSIVSCIIDESRVLIAALLFNISITYFIINYLEEEKNFIYKLLKWGMLVALISAIFTMLYFNTDLGNNDKINSVIDRFVEINQHGKIGSLNVRRVTNTIAWEEIKNKPLGYGLGSAMGLYNTKGGFVRNGNFIDNLPLTILHKIGFIGFGVFLIFYLREIINIIRIYRKSNYDFGRVFSICILLCLPAFIINSAAFTAQMIITQETNAYILVLFAFADTYLRYDIYNEEQR